MTAWDADADYQDQKIERVEAGGDAGWQLHYDGCMCFWVDAPSPVTPVAGMVARLYGKGLGYRVRGLLLDGECVYYRTASEDAAKDEQDRYGKDCEDLLARWDGGGGVWSIEMGGIGPGYEQCIHLTAFEMLRRLLQTKPDAEMWEEPTIWKATLDDLTEHVTPVVRPLGLSGAQWGAGVSLATMFYRHGPIEAIKKANSDRHLQVSKNFPSLAAPVSPLSGGGEG